MGNFWEALGEHCTEGDEWGYSAMSLVFTFFAVPLLIATSVTWPATTKNYLVAIRGEDVGATLGLFGACYYTVDALHPTVHYTNCTASHLGYALNTTLLPALGSTNTTANAATKAILQQWERWTHSFVLTPIAAGFCALALLGFILSFLMDVELLELSVILITAACGLTGVGMQIKWALHIWHNISILTNNQYKAHLGSGLYTAILAGIFIALAFLYAFAPPFCMLCCPTTACCLGEDPCRPGVQHELAYQRSQERRARRERERGGHGGHHRSRSRSYAPYNGEGHPADGSCYGMSSAETMA